QAIDPATANPLCILTGIKLTPKDGTWDNNDKINVVNSGSIGYRIYLRANALYSFAQKPENQEIYGIYPFVNPDLETEKGGYFESVYKEFEDKYTLINSNKNGWFHEGAGYVYYVDGEKLTGINNIEGFYYDMGDDGINIGQTKYTGLIDIDGVNHYAKNGSLVSGWVTIGGDKYCFAEDFAAYDGTVEIDEVEMTFDNGLLTGGYTGFVDKTDGNTYYYDNGNRVTGWLEINGYLYYFDTYANDMMIKDRINYAPNQEAKNKGERYDFAKDGHVITGYFADTGYYFWAGWRHTDKWVTEGSDKDPNARYRTNAGGHFVTDTTGKLAKEVVLNGVKYTIVQIYVDDILYTFDNSNGKLLDGQIKYVNGKPCYYWAGEPFSNGWLDTPYGTHYGYPDGRAAIGTVVIDGRTYTFDGNGRLTSGVRPVYPDIPDEPDSSYVPEYTYLVDVYRLYNVKTTEHFYTIKESERDAMVREGWNYEGVGFKAPGDDGVPVYRLYSPASKFHHYAYDKDEIFDMIRDGWIFEGFAWYCGRNAKAAVPVYRLFAQHAVIGTHHYTASEKEKDLLVAEGWRFEGRAWYGIDPMMDEPDEPVTPEEPDVPDTPDVPEDSLYTYTVPAYRFNNIVTGEQFYTVSASERDTLMNTYGWKYDGVEFYMPGDGGQPIYRLLHPKTYYHHFTPSQKEIENLVAEGWINEGFAFYSGKEAENPIPVYRVFNLPAAYGTHAYTIDEAKRDALISQGWRNEGIGWYAVEKMD
ncbi:MAG: hypothetical protein IKJ05_05785, partial [Oscillospiraceae bacterium]|nr:hypothetical protein [Oscillospiraceae bacterium]